MARQFRLLVVGHAADRTGAPISTLGLVKAWATRPGIDLRVVLRRGGPLVEAYRALAPTSVFRLEPTFRLTDALSMGLRQNPLLTLKGLRNPDRPFILSRKEAAQAQAIADDLSAWQPDAVYVSTSHCGDVLQALRLKAPVLTHVRELSDVLAALDPARRRIAMEGSAAFAVVSQPVQDVLSTEYRIDPAAVMLEPPALDLTEVLGKAAAPHEQTTLDRFDNRPYVCGIGSLISRKGPDLFLKTAALASAAGSRLNFIWLGAGDMHAELQAETQALGLAETVHWLGQVANPYPLLKRAVALALTSREDPHPRTMVEAATLGTPTVAFAGTGGADHFLATYSAGLCVAAYDLKTFHAALLEQQGQRVSVEPVRRQFDVENSAERLLQSLKTLAA